MRGRLSTLIAILALLCGCVHLPTTELPSISKVPSLGVSALGASPARRAIQTAVNYTATLSILGGLACLVFGGLAIYGGQVLPGIKLVIAGVLLPIAGIWWSYHWLWVTIFILIGLAVYLLITHYALIRPSLAAVESWAETVEARFNVAVAAPVVVLPPVSPPAPVKPAAIVTVASITAAIHKA
jgi:hypothetical protein